MFLINILFSNLNKREQRYERVSHVKAIVLGSLRYREYLIPYSYT